MKHMGFRKCENDPCVLIATPLDGEPAIYVGVYVDDFIYFSALSDVEAWFQKTLGTILTVDFMGPVAYFLGYRYQWTRQPSGGLSVHISQPGFTEQLLQKHQMDTCVPSTTPYRSGLPIDRIEPHTGDATTNPLVGPYRSLMGALTSSTISTRPDLSVAHKLLSKHVTNPSAGHMEAAKHVLRYLRGTTEHGIQFVQQKSDNAIHGYVSWPLTTPPPQHTRPENYTDSNWGPQDASRPLPEEQETRTVTSDECKSIQGAIIIRCGGPIWWKVEREERCSRSSCEAEIKSMDLATKEGQHIVTYLMDEMNLLPSTAHPIPIFNDNKGAVDWSSTGAITKRLRHLNMREIAVRDAIRDQEIAVHHIPGKVNPANLLTKEHRDVAHFRELRDILVPSISGVGGVGNETQETEESNEIVARRVNDARQRTRETKTMRKQASWADVVKGKQNQ